MRNEPTEKRNFTVPKWTAKMLEHLANELRGIDPRELRFRRSGNRRRISLSEVADCVMWEGARKVCADNGIEFPEELEDGRPR